MNQGVQYLSLADRKLAYQHRNAAVGQETLPGIVFLGGFASDMTGTKASFLDEFCAQNGWGYLRYDYRGHGASSGKFEDGCIGDWLDDTLKILDELTKGPQILVGSSMGGWIGLLALRARPSRIAGFVGIAAAPDFTEDLIAPTMTAAQKEAMARDGYFFEKTEEELTDINIGQVPITRKLMEEARGQLVLRSPLAFTGPVRLLQGQRDREVPWQTALKIADHIASTDVAVTLVKDADHRFSRDQDLVLIGQTIITLMS
ncbi:MAG: alpha/beta hydrolase [Proteobacteria bacterium]|jgi:pimeloyl-ACP methyl ester carboxylesterase|nr:alpha/beta hydrolase [Alphaproteobacteria bacterium]NCC03847.1 alpha/beta hydrolase [Pseudomonadota bacterium]